MREYNRNREKILKFCLEEKKLLQREAQLTGTQLVMEQNKPGTHARAPEAQEEGPTRAGQEHLTWKATSPYNSKQDHPTKNPTGTPKNYERKTKALSPSKKTIRPTKNKTSAFEQRAKEAAIAQTKLTLARKRLQQPEQKQHALIHMDANQL